MTYMEKIIGGIDKHYMSTYFHNRSSPHPSTTTMSPIITHPKSSAKIITPFNIKSTFTHHETSSFPHELKESFTPKKTKTTLSSTLVGKIVSTPQSSTTSTIKTTTNQPGRCYICRGPTCSEEDLEDCRPNEDFCMNTIHQISTGNRNITRA